IVQRSNGRDGKNVGCFPHGDPSWKPAAGQIDPALHTFRRPPDWLVPPQDYRQQPVQPPSMWELNGLASPSRSRSFCFSVEGASGAVHNNTLTLVCLQYAKSNPTSI